MFRCSGLLARYVGVGQEFAKHIRVDHDRGQYVIDGAGTNLAENFFSQFKRSIDGTHHHVSREAFAPLSGRVRLPLYDPQGVRSRAFRTAHGADRRSAPHLQAGRSRLRPINRRKLREGTPSIKDDPKGLLKSCDPVGPRLDCNDLIGPPVIRNAYCSEGRLVGLQCPVTIRMIHPMSVFWKRIQPNHLCMAVPRLDIAQVVNAYQLYPPIAKIRKVPGNPITNLNPQYWRSHGFRWEMNGLGSLIKCLLYLDSCQEEPDSDHCGHRSHGIRPMRFGDGESNRSAYRRLLY